MVTDENGLVTQTLDYYPYGSERIDSGTADSQRTFIGEYFDQESDLSYLNARYYSGDRGQFLSEDPVFWEIGQTNDGKNVLTTPQLQNSYSYAGDNPIKDKDPTGRFLDILLDIAFIANDVREIYNAQTNGQSTGMLYAALAADVIGAAIPGATGLGVGVKALDKTVDAARVTGAGTDAAKVETKTTGSFQVGASIGKIHGNSLDYPGITTGYTLREVGTDKVLKYGETTKSNPSLRYTGPFYEKTNSYLKPEIQGPKQNIHKWQHDQILKYKGKNQAQRPPLNKSDW